MWAGSVCLCVNKIALHTGEIKDGKVSGFHNWIRFYLLEKQGLLNYYSHSFDGPVSNFFCFTILPSRTVVFLVSYDSTNMKVDEWNHIWNEHLIYPKCNCSDEFASELWGYCT